VLRVSLGIANPPRTVAWNGLITVKSCHQCGARKRDADEQRSTDQPSTGTTSGVARRRGANGRKKRLVACASQLETRERLDRTARFERNFGYTRNEKNTSRQVLQDLALEAIVVGGMGGAAGDIGRVGVAMPFLRGRARVVIDIVLCSDVLMRRRM
jgi:hypothetical protein